MEGTILLPESCLRLPRPREVVLLRLQDVVEVAQLDELGSVEVQALDMKPSTRSEPEQLTLDRLLDVCDEVR